MAPRIVEFSGVVAALASLAACGAATVTPAHRPRPSPPATHDAIGASGSAPRPRRGLEPLEARTRRPGSAVRTPLPILMYHVISPAPAGAKNPALWVTRAEFAAQVHRLRARGYEAVTLQRAWDAWHGRDSLPAKPVVLSFDDGYLSQYTNAAKVLRPMGWPGVLNLKVANIGPDGLTPYEVKAMVAAGWELDAHSLTHPDLTAVGPRRLRREVSGSRRALQRRFGVPVRFFCYPSGRFDAAAKAAVRRAGFLAATTTREGLASPGADHAAEPRIRVKAGDSPAAVLRFIEKASVAPESPNGR